MNIPFITGRIGRKKFWLQFIGFGVAGILLFSMPEILRQQIDNYTYLIGEFFSALMFIMGIVACFFAILIVPIRRYHDIGLSGFWGIVPLSLCVVSLYIYLGYPLHQILAFIPLKLMVAWFGVICGILPGAVEENRFGKA